MTRKETVSRNIGLTFDFLRKVVKDPSIMDKIPDGTTLEFVEKDFSQIVQPTIRKSRTKRKYLRIKSDFDLI